MHIHARTESMILCGVLSVTDLVLLIMTAHKRDIARAEDSLMVPYGTEVIGMQRDWNEELQSCREFPRENLQDR